MSALSGHHTGTATRRYRAGDAFPRLRAAGRAGDCQKRRQECRGSLATDATGPPSEINSTARYRCVASRRACERGWSPSLACLAMSWDARASVKRGALPLCRANDPRRPKAYIRDDVDQDSLTVKTFSCDPDRAMPVDGVSRGRSVDIVGARRFRTLAPCLDLQRRTRS
jgi:hypothetical protein